MRIIYKIIALILLVLAFNFLLEIIVPVPFANSDSEFIKKHADYLNNHSESEVLFLGSSRVKHHIIPYVFDTSLNENRTLDSYNLGVSLLTPPHSYYLLEEILNHPAEDLKFIIIEMERVTVSKKQEACHFLDADAVFFSGKAILDSEMSYYKREFFTQLGLEYFRGLMNYGFLSEYPLNMKYSSDIDGLYQRGFMSIDQQYIRSGNNKLLARRHNLDSLELAQKKAINTPLHDSIDHINQTHLDKINDLIELSNDRGIRLIFLLGTRTEFDHKELRELYNAISPHHKIDLGNSIKFPELYSKEYYWDRGHYNEKGAILYTKTLAKEFDSLVSLHPIENLN
ncbi:MAG: hypothetical protein ABJF11_00810 [Reichenbachiella sp.]|uniref:hypothetical protein n=1 Tax=Reichenbachiella sp. TaxID=2184521 RepID=UPI003266D969